MIDLKEIEEIELDITRYKKHVINFKNKEGVYVYQVKPSLGKEMSVLAKINKKWMEEKLSKIKD